MSYDFVFNVGTNDGECEAQKEISARRRLRVSRENGRPVVIM